MNEKDEFYKKFNGSDNSGSSFGKSVFISFISGLLGAVLVIGVVFGIPSLKNKLFNISYYSETPSSIATSTSNLEQISLSKYSDTAIYASNKVLPSIVGITVEYNITSNSFFSGPQSSTATAEGSGIIMSRNGYILTNNHIINSDESSSYYEVTDATSIKVSLYNDSNQYDAKIIGFDEETDLAVIKIEKDDLTPAEIGDSSSVKIGEFVLAVGNPLGMQSSVSSGIVSAINRTVAVSDGQTFTLIQTDAAINAGNSGGALVNSQGKVIGVNTLKLSGTGIEGMGFSIPINDTLAIYNELKEKGKVVRPYIGISGVNVSESTAKRYDLPIGIYVQSIEKGSSAANSDLKSGDVIIGVDGKEVKTMDEINMIKNSKKIGDKITLEISRDNKKLSIDITLKEKP